MSDSEQAGRLWAAERDAGQTIVKMGRSLSASLAQLRADVGDLPLGRLEPLIDAMDDVLVQAERWRMGLGSDGSADADD